MKVLIFCVSKYYGNTKKIAQAMASALDAQVIEPKEAIDGIVSSYDMVGFGSGIYFGKHDSSLLDLVDKLPKCKKKAFVFSTRGRNSLFETAYHKVLRKKLVEKGFDLVGEFSCRGFSDYYKIFKFFGGVNKGHPKRKELDNAKTFALGLSGKN